MYKLFFFLFIMNENCLKIQKHLDEYLKTAKCCDIEINTICDNDCGSFECKKCKKEWHINSKGIVKKEHNPICGDSDEYE